GLARSGIGCRVGAAVPCRGAVGCGCGVGVLRIAAAGAGIALLTVAALAVRILAVRVLAVRRRVAEPALRIAVRRDRGVGLGRLGGLGRARRDRRDVFAVRLAGCT